MLFPLFFARSSSWPRLFLLASSVRPFVRLSGHCSTERANLTPTKKSHFWLFPGFHFFSVSSDVIARRSAPQYLHSNPFLFFLAFCLTHPPRLHTHNSAEMARKRNREGAQASPSCSCISLNVLSVVHTAPIPCKPAYLSSSSATTLCAPSSIPHFLTILSLTFASVCICCLRPTPFEAASLRISKN